MNAVESVCYVGRNEKSGSFVLLPYAEDLNRPGLFVYSGPVIPVSKEEMILNGPARVFQLLSERRKSDQRKPDDNKNLTNNELLKLKRSHTLAEVSFISLENQIKEIEFTPLHAKRGWQFEASLDEVQRLRIPFNDSEFLRILNRTLTVAT